MKEIGTHELEETVDRLARQGEFSLDEVLKSLDVTDPESREVWTNRLRRELDTNESYFTAMASDRYLLRSQFFHHGHFLIVPGEWELEEGILIIGHRLAPYCNLEVFPSEAVLRCEEGDWQPEWKPFEARLVELLGLHMLLGAEELLSYLIAEFASNGAVLHSETPREEALVKINVLDMKEYYRKHEFESGDALALTIEDYDRGVFSFHYLDGSKRSEAARRQWCERYESALLAVIARFGDSLTIPEQLQQAYFDGGHELLTHDGGSINEFYQSARELKIVFDPSSHSHLGRQSEVAEELADEADALSVPDGFGISSGTVDALERMFQELGLTLSLNEVDSFILDQLALGIQDFDALCDRIFGEKKLPFVDEAQEVIFLNALEERLEVLSESYDRTGDAERVELRRQILELSENRLQFMREAAEVEAEFDQLPEEAWRKLTESSLYLNNILDLLNAPGAELDADAAEKLSEAIDDMAGIQEKALDELREKLNL